LLSIHVNSVYKTEKLFTDCLD